MPSRPFKLALVGATGEVGRAALDALDTLELPIAELRPLASSRSAGTTIELAGDDVRVVALADDSFRGVDVALFCAGPDVARSHAPKARAAGCAVVDVSAAFRADADVPLIVADVNASELAAALERGGARKIVATPAPLASALAAVLAPLRAAAGLERLVVSTYESVSGEGRAGVAELEREARDLLALREPDPAARLPHRIAFNLIPQAGLFAEGGATDVELELARDTRRVLGAPELRVAVTAVRVPIFYGHAAAVNVTTSRPLPAADARELLRAAPGVKLVDDPAQGIYPMPMLAASDEAVLVGRVRDDRSQERGLDLFVVVENTRKAATNALHVARLLAERRP